MASRTRIQPHHFLRPGLFVDSLAIRGGTVGQWWGRREATFKRASTGREVEQDGRFERGVFEKAQGRSENSMLEFWSIRSAEWIPMWKGNKKGAWGADAQCDVA